TPHTKKQWTASVGSILARNQSPTTLRQWLMRLHVLALRHRTRKGCALTSVHRGAIHTRWHRKGIYVSPLVVYLETDRCALLRRMGTMTPPGSGSKVVLAATATTSTRCLHIIRYTHRYHMTLVLSLHSIRTIHFTKTKVNSGKRKETSTHSGN